MRWVAIALVMSLCGCSMAQMRQEFIGYFANDVRNSKNKQVESFDINAADCLAKIKDALKEMSAMVRENRRKQYIVADNFQKVFRSSIDTTQVGILVTSKGADKCEVQIASGNADLAIFVAKKISGKLRAQPEESAVKEEEKI